MGVSQRSIPVQELRVGMFVSDLDRPWHETPFPIQGFYIRSEQEIKSLASYCRQVSVDIDEGRDTPASDAFEPHAIFKSTGKTEKRHQGLLKLPPLHVKNPQHYEESASLKREVKFAEQALALAQSAIDQVISALRQGRDEGAGIRLDQVERAASLMTESVIRNPNALVWLMRIQKHDDYTYQHSLNASVWALVFGRHLGLQPKVLTSLAEGVLLSHIGKLTLPAQILQNELMLDADDYKVFRGYVNTGVAMLEQEQASKAVINVVQFHRERHNGSGFPAGVTGESIPLLAKIAGIVDFYETLIEPRAGQIPLTAAQAVSKLYESRNIEFQDDLVEQFIQAVGVYPTGTLVALSNSQLGIVLSHKPARRLWPTVMLVTDEKRHPLKNARILDLAAYNEGRAVHDSLQIGGCLPLGSPEVDPAQYEVTGASSKWSWRHMVGG